MLDVGFEQASLNNKPRLWDVGVVQALKMT